jgi:hypothetical protein
VYALETVLIVLETVNQGPLLPQTLYKCFELCEVMLRQRFEHEHKADVCHALLSIVENSDGTYPLVVAKRAANTLVTLCCGCTAEWKQQFLVRAKEVLQQLPQELQDILHFVTDDAPPVKPEPASSSARARSSAARSAARLGSPPGRPPASALSPHGGMSPYEQQKLQQQQHNEQYHQQMHHQQQQKRHLSPYEQRRSRPAAVVFAPRPTAMSIAQRSAARGDTGRPQQLRSPGAARGSVRSAAAAVKAEPVAAAAPVSVKSESSSCSSAAPLPAQPPLPPDDSDEHDEKMQQQEEKEEEGAVRETRHQTGTATGTTAAAADSAGATITTAAGAGTTAGTTTASANAVPTTTAVVLANSAPAASSSSSSSGFAAAVVQTAPVLTAAPIVSAVATHGGGLHQQVHVCHLYM